MTTHNAGDPKSDGGEIVEPVGYGKPPKRTRFGKGRSGNPKGRPKGSVSLQQLIRKQLSQRITVTVAGKRQSMTKKEAIAMTIVTSGLKSDPRAVAAILQIESLAEHKVEPPDPNTPLKDDEVIIAIKRRFERAAQLSARNGEAERDTPRVKPAGKKAAGGPYE